MCWLNINLKKYILYIVDDKFIFGIFGKGIFV